MSSHLSHTTTDHDEIRRWAEQRGAKPACVKGTGGKGEPGMIRLDFPGFSGSESLQHISWDEWFQAFDANDLALVYQDRSADGARSNFNKLIARDTADAREHGDSNASRRRGRSHTSHGTASHGSSKSSQRETSAHGASGGNESSLKEREYRDEHGQVHHHTHKYMDEHRSGSDSKR